MKFKATKLNAITRGERKDVIQRPSQAPLQLSGTGKMRNRERGPGRTVWGTRSQIRRLFIPIKGSEMWVESYRQKWV